MASTLYSVLGVSPTASSDEIKRQFKKLAVKYHPDKTDDASHHEMFLQINKAYETLRDDERRKEYDVKNGIHVASSSASSFSDMYNNNFRSHHGFSYYSPGKTYADGGSSYFSFFQRNYRTYTDAAKSHFESYERPNSGNSAAAAAAAKLAQKKMEEDLKRRQREQAYEEQRQRQENLRRERERQARDQIERQLREQRERMRQQNERMKEKEYQRFKAEAHRRQWETFYEVDESESDEQGTANSSGRGGRDEPIIIEDDGDISESFEDCQASPPDTTQHQDSTLADDNETRYASGQTHVKQENGISQDPIDSEPEVVEVRSPVGTPDAQHDDSDDMNGPASPKRAHYEGSESYSEASAPKKPAREIDMSNLRSSLGTSIDDTNFRDMLDSLPQSFSQSTAQRPSTDPPSPGKTRKPSVSVHRVPNKRARYNNHSEGFTDGRARAETLHTPVNKAPTRRNNSIAITDLSPEFDERRLMFATEPPRIKITAELTTEAWLNYTRSFHEYERGFAAFRTAVLEYQQLRLQKDERHHDTIYDDTTCLDAFSSCLFNDMLLLQNYGRAFQEFREAVKTFRRNCELKREIETQENIRI